MCEPATIMAAVSAVGSAMSLQSQADAAEAQAENINKATVDNYASLNRQAIEDRENQSVEQSQIQRTMVERTATAKAAAAGSEISGLSVDALLLDLAGKGLEAGTTSEQNYLRAGHARSDEFNQTRNTAQSQLNQIRTPGVADYLGVGLKIADAGIKWKNRNNPKGI